MLQCLCSRGSLNVVRGPLNHVVTYNLKLYGKLRVPPAELLHGSYRPEHLHHRLFTSGLGFKPSQKLLRLQRNDGVPPRYELIYRTDMCNYFLGWQCVMISSLLGLLTTLVAYYVDKSSDDENQVIENAPVEAAAPSTNELTRRIEEVQAEMEKKEPLRPILKELWEEDMDVGLVILSFTVSMMILCFRILRQFPVRLYASPKGHCYGIFYNGVIPGLKFQREFVAGTLKPAGKSSFLFRNMYKDGSGMRMILLEHYFRQPSDFNNLMESNHEKSAT